MRRSLFLACITGLTLSLTSVAYADDVSGCDMLCRLKGYLATDHMAPSPIEAAAPRTGPSKHARTAAATHQLKAAAAARQTAAKTADAKPASVAEASSVSPKTARLADATPAPSPASLRERHRSTAETATRPSKAALAARADVSATRQDASRPPVVAADTPLKRAATHVAALDHVIGPDKIEQDDTQKSEPTVRHHALAARHPTAQPPLQTATAGEITTSQAVAIPGSAPLVAAGFR